MFLSLSLCLHTYFSITRPSPEPFRRGLLQRAEAEAEAERGESQTCSYCDVFGSQKMITYIHVHTYVCFHIYIYIHTHALICCMRLLDGGRKARLSH